jgi:hypothetical protein
MAKSKPHKLISSAAGEDREQLFLPVDATSSSRSKRSLVGPGDTNPFGGASQEDLAAVVATDLGADPNLEVPEVAIAVESLARVVAARMANSEWPADPKRLAIFIVSDRVRDLAAQLGATREPIIDNGSRSLTGKLWVTAASFASGYFSTFAAADPASIFEEVKAKGIGDRPALVFDPAATQAEIRYYPRGLDNDAFVQRFVISNKPYTLAELDEVLNRLHQQSIITPDAALPDFNPWKDSRKYLPRDHAEAFFQGMLKLVLDVAFGPRYRVAFEIRGTEGRCDLLISSRHPDEPNSWISHAALELKVLRSFTSGGSAVSAPARAKAIHDGLLQAIAYRRENNALDGLLCCYDMRMPRHYDGLSCFKPVDARAKRNRIKLRNYHLYASSKDLRTDRYGGGSTSA